MRARAILVAAGIFSPADSGRTEYVLGAKITPRLWILLGILQDAIELVAQLADRDAFVGGQEVRDMPGQRLRALRALHRAFALGIFLCFHALQRVAQMIALAAVGLPPGALQARQEACDP